MSYDFTDISGHRIYPATGVAMASIFSFWIRLRMKSDASGANNRWLASFVNDIAAGTPLYNFYMLFRSGATNALSFGFSKSVGTVFPELVWTTGWTTPLEVSLGFHYSGLFLGIWEGTDATPKASLAETGTPDQSSARLSLGNYYSAITPPTINSGPWKIHEAAWWPGVAITGANFAALGAGDATGVPLPANYWPCNTGPEDIFGGKDGVVTGASLVAHTGINLYAPPAALRRSMISVPSGRFA